MICTINSLVVQMIEATVTYKFDGEVIAVTIPVSTPTRTQAIDEIVENAKAQRRAQLAGSGIVQNEYELEDECRKACANLDLSQIGL